MVESGSTAVAAAALLARRMRSRSSASCSEHINEDDIGDGILSQLLTRHIRYVTILQSFFAHVECDYESCAFSPTL